MCITGFSHESKLLKQLASLSDERKDLILCEAIDKTLRQGNKLSCLVDVEINDCEEDCTSVNKKSRGCPGLIHLIIQFSLQYAIESCPSLPCFLMARSQRL